MEENGDSNLLTCHNYIFFLIFRFIFVLSDGAVGLLKRNRHAFQMHLV